MRTKLLLLSMALLAALAGFLLIKPLGDPVGNKNTELNRKTKRDRHALDVPIDINKMRYTDGQTSTLETTVREMGLTTESIVATIRSTNLPEATLAEAMKNAPDIWHFVDKPDWETKRFELVKEREVIFESIKMLAESGIWEIAIAQISIQTPVYAKDYPGNWQTSKPVFDFLKDALTRKEPPYLEGLIVEQVFRDSDGSTIGESELRRRGRAAQLMKLLESVLATGEEQVLMDRSRWISELATRHGCGPAFEKILFKAAPMVRH